jgi:geranylgeranyl reductase family protein
MKNAYDIVIVGCGMAGALAGLAALREGLSVCIIERRQRKYIGKKICGELMPQKTLEWLKNEFNIVIDHYPLKGLAISSRLEHSLCDSSSMVCIEEPLCTIDRWQFGQVMMKELLERGADLLHDTAKGPLYGHCINGVKTQNFTIYGTVTIDCSGISSTVWRKLHSPTNRTTPHFGIAYKEDVVLAEPLSLDYALLVFDKTVIPSGYMWLFPKSETLLNTGVGGLIRGHADLKDVLRKTLAAHLVIGERFNGGVGVLPLELTVSSLVYPGLLVCGDAACQVNPLTGEGIAPALMAGYQAGKVAAQAVHNNDVSVSGMWQYNCALSAQHGMFCAFSVLRDFLMSLSGEELTFLLKNMITSESLAQLEKDWSPSTQDKMTIFLNSCRKPKLLYELYSVFRKMTKIKKMYARYPEDPEMFSDWQHRLDAFFR